MLKKEALFEDLSDGYDDIQLYMGWCVCQITPEVHGSRVKSE